MCRAESQARGSPDRGSVRSVLACPLPDGGASLYLSKRFPAGGQKGSVPSLGFCTISYQTWPSTSTRERRTARLRPLLQQQPVAAAVRAAITTAQEAGNSSMSRLGGTGRQSGSSTEGHMRLPRLSGARATTQDGSQRPMQHELQLQLQRPEGAACLQRVRERATRGFAHRCHRRTRQREARSHRAQIRVGLPLHGGMAQVHARICLPTMTARTVGQRRSRCERARADMPDKRLSVRRIYGHRSLPLVPAAIASQEPPLEDTGSRTRSRNNRHISRPIRAASSNHSMSLTQPPPCGIVGTAEHP